MKKAFVGTSGFSYKSWAGNFYPGDLPQSKWLEYYAERFSSVEINNSFYHLPNKSTYENWRKRTPNQFRFAIKGSRYITQMLGLANTEEAVDKFFERAEALGDKLSVVLWQLPPSARIDLEKLTSFALVLSNHPVAKLTRHAFEFRHHSWFEDSTYDLMRQHNFGTVIAHSERWPSTEAVTADFIYLRFHGAPELFTSNYSDADLKTWAQKARQLAEKRDIYAYFNNDAAGYAPTNAQSFSKLLK